DRGTRVLLRCAPKSQECGRTRRRRHAAPVERRRREGRALEHSRPQPRACGLLHLARWHGASWHTVPAAWERLAGTRGLEGVLHRRITAGTDHEKKRSHRRAEPERRRAVAWLRSAAPQ